MLFPLIIRLSATDHQFPSGNHIFFVLTPLAEGSVTGATIMSSPKKYCPSKV